MTIQQCIETIPPPLDAPTDLHRFIHEDVDLAYSPTTGKCYRLLTTKWKLIKAGTSNKTYTQININGSMQLLHRIIAQHFMNDGKPITNTDYVDHDKHPNGTHQQDILTNLRITSSRGNQANRTGGTSKFAGVFWHVRDSKWCAQIVINNHQKHIGYFQTESEAAKAYIQTGEEHGCDMSIARERFQSVTGNAKHNITYSELLLAESFHQVPTVYQIPEKKL